MVNNSNSRKRPLPDTDLSENHTPQMTYTDVVSGLEAVREKMDRRIEKICEVLEKTNAKLIEDVPEQQDRLRGIAESVGTCRIGFYGQRGAGKTTMINRLLGLDCDLLPTGQHTAITASITEIQGWDRDFYSAIITFITKEEWIEFVNDVKSDMADLDYDSGEQPRYNSFDQQLSSMYRRVETARYDKLTGQDSQGRYGWQLEDDPFQLLPSDIKQMIETGYEVIRSDSVKELAAGLLPYTFRARRFWPIVVKISISGPFEILQKHKAMLIDLPGTDDGDYALTRRFENGQVMCDRLFYLPSQNVMLSAITANECVNFYSMTCDFGLILPKINELLQDHLFQDDLRSVDDIVPFVRKKLGDDYFKLQREARAQIQSIKMYPVENDPTLLAERPEYRKLLENFINEELACARPKEGNVYRNFIATANLWMDSLRIRLGRDVSRFQCLKTRILGITPPETDFGHFLLQWKSEFESQQSFEELPAKLRTELKDKKWHYKQLQVMLRNIHSGPRKAFVQFITAQCIQSEMIELLRTELERITIRVKTVWKSAINEKAGYELDEIRESLFGAIECCVFVSDTTTFRSVIYYTAVVELLDYFSVTSDTLSQLFQTGRNAKANMVKGTSDFVMEHINGIKERLVRSVMNKAGELQRQVCNVIKKTVTDFFTNITSPIHDPTGLIGNLLQPLPFQTPSDKSECDSPDIDIVTTNDDAAVE